MNPKNPTFMPNPTSHPKSTAGKLFFVSGLAGGREVFLGKAIDEPYEGRLSLEGKTLTLGHQGFVIARPFATTATFTIENPAYGLQHISDPRAHEEAIHVLNHTVTQVSRTAFPLLCRWVEAACHAALGTIPTPGAPFAGTAPIPNPTVAYARDTLAQANPLQGFYQGFLGTAEQFRRSLFHSRQIRSTRELDKVAELEGNLAIEIGKLANQIAVKFHQLAIQEDELYPYLESFHGADLPAAGIRHSMAGWLFLFERLQFARSWARREGKTALVREVNALIKDGITGLNEVILDHCNSLDTLITETFSQYGIAYEIHGELSPFIGYTGPAPSAVERELVSTGAN